MEKKLFGTDGIRGVANEYPITPEVMIKLGRAIISSLPDSEGKKRILIGKDSRISGDMIESAIAAGICSMNGDAFLAGVIPTPGISCLTVSGGYDAGIVISASHNPYYDNGIKIFNHQGFKLSDEIEKEIEGKVLDDSLIINPLLSKDIGVIKEVDTPKLKYIEFLKNTLPVDYSLEGLKIILDCSNGATSEIAPKLFKKLGADVITIFASPNGTNINDQCGSQHTETLRETVLKNNADIGFAFDGDGDRLIAVDDKGNKVTGDQILAVCAKYLKEKGKLANNVVVSTVMSNVGLLQVLKKLKIKHVIADVGDRYVLEEMKKNNSIIGGEDSGHMIFLDHHTSGDGILTAIRLIQVIKETSQNLSELVKIMKIYPQVLVNVPVKEKIDIQKIPEIIVAIEKVENQLQDQGRVLVRYSGTQLLCRVMVEGPEKEETLKYCQDIVDVISEKIGSK
ncbi:MAG: phosphoglucosamine mutase [Desulfobacteraceae bacterium]|jgi:phosphoglucosamine mutase|nr:phosphoglucosamine mutase [Desulfobacteraceae bacterium]